MTGAPSHASIQTGKAHLVGVGGIGMSALARLLLESGVEVSGSDSRPSPLLDDLRRRGAAIFVGHDAERVGGAARVIFSPAVPSRNAELVAARRLGIPTQTRAEALTELVAGRETVAVAGSHGKTTATAMLALVLTRAGLDPGYMIGGRTPSLDGDSARLGGGGLFVAEACEAFGALDCWSPGHCLITNIDDEHIEHYDGDEGLRRAFAALVARTAPGGVIAICGDDVIATEVCANGPATVVRYGLDLANHLRARIDISRPNGCDFTVFRDGSRLGPVSLATPGLHTVRNALGVIAVALGLGVPFDIIADALGAFTGVDRRWQFLGEAAGVRVFDDFAHHPAEVAATLEVARAALAPGGRLVVAFEPQLHSRARRLATDFATALGRADLVLLAPVDPAGEPPEVARGDEALAAAIELAGTPLIRLPEPESATGAAADLRLGDILVTMGPGRIGAVGGRILESLRAGGEGGQRASGPSISIGADRPLPEPASWLAQVRANAACRPDAPAVECGSATISYARLVARAEGLAAALERAGVGPEQVVAVCLDRSAQRTVAFLGVLMSGGVYLPIDPELPPDRIRFMLEDAQASVVVADPAADAIPRDGSVTIIDPGIQRVPRAPSGRPDPVLTGAEAAYIIYTSGSTGTPKGVIVEHRAICNYARAAAEAFGVTPTSRVSQVSAFGFDVAVGDTAMALYAGACLVAPTDAEARPGPSMARFIRQAAISHLSLTPSALSVLPLGDYPALTHVVLAGEVCPPELAARWSPGRRLFNAYGPTETTVVSTFDEHASGRLLTIGRAMDNAQALILDESERPVGRGETGELWLAGAGLARGYLGRPELTAERFRTLEVAGLGALRAYRTGDLARMDPDGRIRFLGRADDQIKLRGHRIELGEIEAALHQRPDLRDAIVDLRKDASGADQLVAYVVAADGSPVPSRADIASYLAERLPAYMIPAAVVGIASAPMTPNGKRDRAALPEPPAPAVRSQASGDAPGTPLQTALAELIRHELAIEGPVGVRDAFGDLGADSLRMANIFLAVEAQFGIELPAEATFEADTLERLAAHVERTLGAPARQVQEAQSLAESIIRKQLGFISTWTGLRRDANALIVTRNPDGRRAPLFWCFQGNKEHERLAAQLGPGQPLHGMRSGHMVFRYQAETVLALASRYADEMTALQPTGAFRMGGNCQGGVIARETALQLMARGREVAMLIMVEQGKFHPYPAPVALVFGADSHLKPMSGDAESDPMLDAAYPAGWSVQAIPGRHGTYFAPKHIEALAAAIRTSLERTQGPARSAAA